MRKTRDMQTNNSPYVQVLFLALLLAADVYIRAQHLYKRCDSQHEKKLDMSHYLNLVQSSGNPHSSVKALYLYQSHYMKLDTLPLRPFCGAPS
jgi:hypothetical protein